MKQSSKQDDMEKMNESIDSRRKAYSNYVPEINIMSKDIVASSINLSIAKRYNNGKPYDFTKISQFVKFINDFFNVEFKKKPDIPQLDFDNIITNNSYNSYHKLNQDSYQSVQFFNFIADIKGFFSSGQLDIYYNDDSQQSKHNLFKITFLMDPLLSLSSVINVKFNNGEYFDPSKPINIVNFMHFIMDLYIKFNSIEFIRIMNLNIGEKDKFAYNHSISYDVFTMCCLQYLLSLKSKNHQKEYAFKKTFYNKWTKSYDITWKEFAEYWNTKIVSDKPDMQIKISNSPKAISESINTIRQKKNLKQKEDQEKEDTLGRKSKEIAGSIIWQNKIKALLIDYDPKEKNQDLNDPEVFVRLTNGIMSHYLQMPVNLIFIDIAIQSAKRGNGKEFYPAQKNISTFLSDMNFKEYEIDYNIPSVSVLNKIFFKKKFVQSLFKGIGIYGITLVLNIHLFIEHGILKQIELVFTAGMTEGETDTFSISIPISDINNSPDIFYVFLYCEKILKNINSPEFIAYMLTKKMLTDNVKKAVSDSSALKIEDKSDSNYGPIIEKNILISIFMDIDKSGQLHQEYLNNKKMYVENDPVYAKAINDLYQNKIEYVKGCFKFCDDKYIGTNNMDESINARKKYQDKQKTIDTNTGKEMSIQIFTERLLDYDLNNKNNLLELIKGFLKKKFQEPKIYFEFLFTKESNNKFTYNQHIGDKTGKYELSFTISGCGTLLDKRLNSVCDKINCDMTICFAYSDGNIQDIDLNLIFGCGFSTKETEIIHIPFSKDKNIEFYNFIKYLNNVIDKIRTPEFAAFLMTFYILYENEQKTMNKNDPSLMKSSKKSSAGTINVYGTGSLILYSIFYSIFKTVIINNKLISTLKIGQSLAMKDIKSEERTTIMNIYKKQLKSMNSLIKGNSLINESIFSKQKFNSTKENNSNPGEIGKSIVLKNNLEKLFNEFAPDIIQRNTRNMKSVIALIKNFCIKKLDKNCFSDKNSNNANLKINLPESDMIQTIFTSFTLNAKDKVINNIYITYFTIQTLSSTDEFLKTIKISLKFTYGTKTGTYVDTNKNKISLTYNIKNEYDFETIFNVLKFIAGLNEFITSEKYTALLNTMWLSLKNHSQLKTQPIFPVISSAYYNKLICDLLKGYDNTGELKHISESHQKWIMQSKENQLKYEIVYKTFMKQYKKVCNKRNKTEKISESVNARRKNAIQNSTDEIKNNTHEMICHSALMSLCGGQDIKGKTIVELIELIIPRIFRKFEDSDNNKAPELRSHQNIAESPYDSDSKIYEIPIIPLISIEKKFKSERAGIDSEKIKQFTNIKINSKLNTDYILDENTVKITLFGENIVHIGQISNITYTGFSIDFIQYDEGYLYSPDPDNFMTNGMHIDFNICFNVAENTAGILNLNNENKNMSDSYKYSVIAQFVNDISKSLEFMTSPLITEGLNQMLGIFKNIDISNLKEREINIINFITTFEYFIKKHVDNFNCITYKEGHDNFSDKYSTYNYKSEIQKKSREFAEKFYNEHLKEFE